MMLHLQPNDGRRVGVRFSGAGQDLSHIRLTNACLGGQIVGHRQEPPSRVLVEGWLEPSGALPIAMAGAWCLDNG